MGLVFNYECHSFRMWRCHESNETAIAKMLAKWLAALSQPTVYATEVRIFPRFCAELFNFEQLQK